MSRGRLPRPLRHRLAKPAVNAFSRFFTAVDVRVARAGRKTIGGTVAGGIPVLLLSTSGRRSGRRRTTPLLYHRESNGDLLLVAANGGAAWNPDWLHDLRARPEAEVDIDGRVIPVVASVLGPTERSAAWATAVEAFPGLEDNQRVAVRKIPIVRLQERHR